MTLFMNVASFDILLQVYQLAHSHLSVVQDIEPLK